MEQEEIFYTSLSELSRNYNGEKGEEVEKMLLKVFREGTTQERLCVIRDIAYVEQLQRRRRKQEADSLLWIAAYEAIRLTQYQSSLNLLYVSRIKELLESPKYAEKRECWGDVFLVANVSYTAGYLKGVREERQKKKKAAQRRNAERQAENSPQFKRLVNIISQIRTT